MKYLKNILGFSRRFQLLICLLFFSMIWIFLWSNQLIMKRSRLLFIVRNETRHSSSAQFSIEERNFNRWKDLQSKYSFLNFSLLLNRSVIEGKTIEFQCTAICGGLGDRLRGLIMTYFFALLLNRRLVVDMYWPCAFTDYFRPNLYQWYPSRNLSSFGSTLRIRAIDHNQDLLKELKNSSFLERWATYDHIQLSTNMDFLSQLFENVHLRKNLVIEMFLRGMSSEEANIHTLFALLFQTLLRPTGRVVRLIDHLMKERSKDNLICAHLRMGQNPSNPQDMPFTHHQTFPQDLIHFLSTKQFLEGNSSQSLFVSSDSVQATDKLLQHFPNRSFIVPGPILQIDRPANNVDCDQGFLKVVADFYLLSECDRIILTNSGFSAFANRRRKDPYHHLYKYNDKEKRFDKCLDIRTSRGWEPAFTVPTKIFCALTTNNNTRK